MGVRVAYALHPEKPDPANSVATVDLLPQRQHGVRLGVKPLHVNYSSFVFGRSGQAQSQLDGHIEIFVETVLRSLNSMTIPSKGARTGAPVFSQTSQPQWNPP